MEIFKLRLIKQREQARHRREKRRIKAAKQVKDQPSVDSASCDNPEESKDPAAL